MKIVVKRSMPNRLFGHFRENGSPEMP